jgi:long-subunit fatty acid transport protein
MPGFVVVGDPKTDEPSIATQDVYGLFAGVSYDYNAFWTWLLQVNAYSTPIENTDIEALDDGAVDLAIGLHYRLAPRWLLEFAFSEDLTKAAPDFTVRFALRWMHCR